MSANDTDSNWVYWLLRLLWWRLPRVEVGLPVAKLPGSLRDERMFELAIKSNLIELRTAKQTQQKEPACKNQQRLIRRALRADSCYYVRLTENGRKYAAVVAEDDSRRDEDGQVVEPGIVTAARRHDGGAIGPLSSKLFVANVTNDPAAGEIQSWCGGGLDASGSASVLMKYFVERGWKPERVADTSLADLAALLPEKGDGSHGRAMSPESSGEPSRTTGQTAPRTSPPKNGRGSGDKTKQRRGPQQRYSESRDEKLLADWEAAQRQGSLRKEFCRERGITLKSLIAAQTRQRERRSRNSKQNR
jgi:hypothetical protein